jgi:hypothetical protein
VTTRGLEALIVDCLSHALSTQSYGDPALPYAWPNVSVKPPPRYLAVSIVFNGIAEQSQEVLPGYARKIGLLQVSVVFPKNVGLVLPMEIATDIINAWPRGARVVSRDADGDLFGMRISGVPYIGSIVEGDTDINVPVIIPWQVNDYTA